MKFPIFFLCLFIFACGGEWAGGSVGKTSCSFDDFMPNARRAAKMAAGNNGNNIYILDDFFYVHHYKRDNLYECAFNLEESYPFNAFPSDVFSADNGFYVQTGAELRFMDDTEACRAKNGIFAVYGNELAVESGTGLEVWGISPCVKKRDVSAQKISALTATDSDYFAAEPQNLAMIPKNGSFIHRDFADFCSADRLAANNFGVYLLDNTCKKIVVYDNQGVWQRTINLSSLGVSGALDIAADKYPYILVLHSSGVEKISIQVGE
jgi:hypothetical protein